MQLLDQANITAATPPNLAPGTLNEIIIVLPDGTQASLEQAWMADFLEGVVEACSTNPLKYCPNKKVERGPMAQYAAKAFRLP